MLNWLKVSATERRKASELYGRVVAAARRETFYRQHGVPDTAEGRFELVALHLFLALERVKTEVPDGEVLAQRTIEAFVTDMDDCMREMGVGDLTVGKKVKRAAAAFYERAAGYRAALKLPDDRALEAVVRQYLGSERTTPASVSWLVDFIRQTSDAVHNTPHDQIFADRR